MSGPEHYQEAERLLGLAERPVADGELGWMARAQVAAEAQVHATLALAAATALVAGDDGRTPLREYDVWSETAGTAVTP
jgi:hypothetical protein